MIKTYIMCFLLFVVSIPAFTQNQASGSVKDSSSVAKTPSSDFNRRWQYDDGASCFIATGNTQWAEVNWKGEVIFRYVFIEEKPAYTLLYDDSRKMYVKLTKGQLFYGNNTEGVVYGGKYGGWIEEPVKGKK